MVGWFDGISESEGAELKLGWAETLGSCDVDGSKLVLGLKDSLGLFDTEGLVLGA